MRGFSDPRAVRLYGTGNSVFEQPNQNSAGVTQSPPTLFPFRPVAPFGPVVTNAEAGCNWHTYPERLLDAGVTWKIYQDMGVGLDAAGAWGWTEYTAAGLVVPLPALTCPSACNSYGSARAPL